MKDFEQKIKEYLVERGWDNLKPVDVAKSIMIEGAELLELFQWANETLEEVKNNPEKMAKIRKELADVMTYCFDLAVVLNIDAEQMLNEKLEYAKEKYPAHLINKQANNDDPGTEDVYWKIKEQYRRDGKN